MHASPTAVSKVGRNYAEAKAEDDDEQRVNWIVSQYSLADVRYATENEKCSKQQIEDSHWAVKPMPVSVPAEPFGNCVTQNGKNHEKAADERKRIIGGSDRDDASDEEKCRDTEIDRKENGVNEQV